MVISPYDTESNYLFWQGDQNLIYFMKFDISFRNKWHSVDHGGGLYMLSEVPLIILIHLRNVITHSSSNECLSL